MGNSTAFDFVCTVCLAAKTPQDFAIRTGTNRPRRQCRKCVSIRVMANRRARDAALSAEVIRDRNRRYRLANQSENARNSRKRNLRRFGITIEQFEEMLERQADRCVLCSDLMTSPHVDHDHLTGNVRGLLCQRCNMGLGLFRDNTTVLANAIAYLTQ